MNQPQKIYEILARDSAFWLPDFSNDVKPLNEKGEFIVDTQSGFEYYCEWLTDYLVNNEVAVSYYKIPIVKRLKRRKEITNPYILGNAAASSYQYFHSDFDFYPSDFLEDPIPARISKSDLKEFTACFDVPKFRGLDANESLQAILVFAFISIKQNEMIIKMHGPKWLDIGWRAMLKAGLLSVKTKSKQLEYTKNFIEEMSYLNEK